MQIFDAVGILSTTQIFRMIESLTCSECLTQGFKTENLLQTKEKFIADFDRSDRENTTLDAKQRHPCQIDFMLPYSQLPY